MSTNAVTPRLVPCVACGGLFAGGKGPTHRYMESSPGCWAAYGEVLAREYGDGAYRRLHRLTVDAYAVQHPGGSSPQAVQSVAVHLMSLCVVLERGARCEDATRLIGMAAGRKGSYPRIEPPSTRGAITVADVRSAASADAHLECVRKWAEAAWLAWQPHHDRVREWINQLT